MVKLYSVNWIQDIISVQGLTQRWKSMNLWEHRQCFFLSFQQRSSKEDELCSLYFFDSRPINPILTEIKTILAKDKESFHVHNIIK